MSNGGSRMHDGAERRGPDEKLLGVERAALFDYLLFGLFVVMVPFALGGSTAIFNDGDVSWHLAAGRWILDNGRIPQVDPFSFTMGGQPWVAFEWLAEIIYASAFGLAGYAGVAAVVTLALMALHLIVFLHLRRRTGPLATLAALVALNVVLNPFTLARPHLLVWPVLAGWTAMLLRARDERRVPALWLALVMTVWSNLHGSYPLGLLVCAGIGLDAVIASGWDRETFRKWLIFGILSAAAAMLNANGIAGFMHPFTVAGLGTLTLIQEWLPSSPSATPWFFAVLLIVLAAVLLKGARLRVGEAALLLLMLALAFYQVRHQSWLVIVAVLVLTPRLAAADHAPNVPKHPRAHIAGAAALVFLALLARFTLPISPAENASNPRRLLAAVPAELRAQPMLNGYTFGGPLILAGIRPYIDGRSDMYGDAFFSDYRQITDGDMPRFEHAVERYGIRWTMLPHAHKRLIHELDQSAEWRRVYADKIGVIHVRTARPAAAPS